MQVSVELVGKTEDCQSLLWESEFCVRNVYACSDCGLSGCPAGTWFLQRWNTSERSSQETALQRKLGVTEKK